MTSENAGANRSDPKPRFPLLSRYATWVIVGIGLPLCFMLGVPHDSVFSPLVNVLTLCFSVLALSRIVYLCGGVPFRGEPARFETAVVVLATFVSCASVFSALWLKSPYALFVMLFGVPCTVLVSLMFCWLVGAIRRRARLPWFHLILQFSALPLIVGASGFASVLVLLRWSAGSHVEPFDVGVTVLLGVLGIAEGLHRLVRNRFATRHECVALGIVLIPIVLNWALLVWAFVVV